MLKLTLTFSIAILVILATAFAASAFDLHKQAFLNRKSRHGLQYEALNSQKHLHQHQKQQYQQPKQHQNPNQQQTVGAPIMGGWMGLNSAFFAIGNPLFNTLINDEMTGFVYKEYNTSELGVHIYLNDITVTNFSCNNCVRLGLGNNYMTLQLTQFSMNLALGYEVKTFLSKSTGTCNPEVDNMNLTAEISFAPPVNGKPQIQISNIQLEVDTLHLNCEGSIIGHFANAMADLFKFFLSDLMDDVLNIFVTHEANGYLEHLQLTFDIDNYSMVNFNLIPSQSYITNRDLSVGVVGIVTPISNPNMSFPFPPPSNLKSQCFAGGMINIGLSQYSIQTAIYTYFIGNKLTATFPGALKSSDLAFIIPGFYQQNKTALLDLTFTASKFDAGSLEFIPNQSQVLLSITMNISIIDPGTSLAFVMQVFADVSMSLSAGGGTKPALQVQIPNLSLSNPQVLSTNVGGSLAAPLVVTLIDGILDSVILGPINKKLANGGGIPLPVIDGFQAVSPRIVFNNNSVCVAMNVAPVS